MKISIKITKLITIFKLKQSYILIIKNRKVNKILTVFFIGFIVFYLATFSSHFTIKSIVSIEIRHAITNTDQVNQIATLS